MPRAGLSASAVVDTALAYIDENGLESLTLAAVAARAGVATPSLYKHVASLAELRSLLGVRVLDDITAQFTADVMGRSKDDAVRALMRSYRGYVRQHPARYAAMPIDALHDPAAAAAGKRLLEVFLAVLRGYGLQGSAAIHAVRCLRAIAHGFTDIEARGGFGLPEGLDETYENLIQMYLTTLHKEI